jgi:hypothetical protein
VICQSRIERAGKRLVGPLKFCRVKSRIRRRPIAGTSSPLTSGTTSISFSAMRISEMRKALKIRHLLSVATLVFVFFLPLHFHLSPATPIAKECSCLHGTRTQLALGGSVSTYFVQFQSIHFPMPLLSVWTDSWARPQNVRAPPSAFSL